MKKVAGGGLRTALLLPDSGKVYLEKLYLFLGNGFMWENELIDTDPDTETKIARSTNYFSINWILKKWLSLKLVTYFQVHVSNIQDYRVLHQGGLGFSLSKWMTFSTGLNLRYDNEPPSGLAKNYDLEMSNGIRFTF